MKWFYCRRFSYFDALLIVFIAQLTSFSLWWLLAFVPAAYLSVWMESQYE